MEDSKNVHLTNKSRPSDDIDVSDILSRIGRGIGKLITSVFKYIYDVLFFIIKFFYKNAVIIGSFTLIGFIVGVGVYFNSKKEYSSEMIASSNSLPNDEMINYINILNELCKTKKYVGLGNYLDMDSSAASKIKSIQALWAYDLNSDGLPDYVDYEGKHDLKYKDTIQTRLWDRFYVKAVVTDEHVFNKLNSGILNYINSNEYIKQNNEIRKKHQEEMIRDIDAEIIKLDSLQKFEYFNQNKVLPQIGANQLVLFTEKETKLYHGEIFALIEKKQTIETNLLVRKDPIVVIQNFTPLAKIENRLLKYLLKYGGVGLALGALIMLIKQYRKKIHQALSAE